jgi:hypothetical protein
MTEAIPSFTNNPKTRKRKPAARKPKKVVPLKQSETTELNPH